MQAVCGEKHKRSWYSEDKSVFLLLLFVTRETVAISPLVTEEILLMSEIDNSKERQSRVKQREIAKKRLKRAWDIVKIILVLQRIYNAADWLADSFIDWLIDRLLEDDDSGPLNNYSLAGLTT